MKTYREVISDIFKVGLHVTEMDVPKQFIYFDLMPDGVWQMRITESLLKEATDER